MKTTTDTTHIFRLPDGSWIDQYDNWHFSFVYREQLDRQGRYSIRKHNGRKWIILDIITLIDGSIAYVLQV
jgi:hypothetical protein